MTLWDFQQVVRIVRLTHVGAVKDGLSERESLLRRAAALDAPIESMKEQILLLMTATCEVYPSTIDLVTDTLIRTEFARDRYLEEAAKLANPAENCR